ncbi:winged helix-turn-helix domain-containing protein [Vibrio mediterranei]|uniref:OmpR/PhoB-type domain-containing protein n=1 Tax=Vibrio mediterranei TaxID=689 RepID=A0A3G4V8B6_9VIBR|nr:winged helix-turn-helix domain-containing protein [Vibrio mediterranei]AYV21023.1 hypothetical protein ECB94_06720 [Vibrio mediterranei]
MNNVLQKARTTDSTIRIGELNYNPFSRELSNSEGSVSLEQRNLDILELLLENVGIPQTSEDIIERIWDSKFVSKNVISNRISSLRATLRDLDQTNDPNKTLITYPKKGYYLNPESVSILDIKKKRLRQEKRKRKI